MTLWVAIAVIAVLVFVIAAVAIGRETHRRWRGRLGNSITGHAECED